MRYKNMSSILLRITLSYISFIVAISFLVSCRPGRCDAPSAGRGSVTVITPLPNPAFDCRYNIASLQTEANLARELNELDKWQVEFLVGGSCSDGKPWSIILKKGAFTMVSQRGQIAFRLNNIPVSDGPIHINAQFTTPCNSSSTMGVCATTNNSSWRNVLGGNLKVDNPFNGVIVEFNNTDRIREASVRNCQ